MPFATTGLPNVRSPSSATHLILTCLPFSIDQVLGRFFSLRLTMLRDGVPPNIGQPVSGGLRSGMDVKCPLTPNPSPPVERGEKWVTAKLSGRKQTRPQPRAEKIWQRFMGTLRIR